MPDPNPNQKVNLSGSGTVPHVQRPDGELVPQQGTNAGEAKVHVVSLPDNSPPETALGAWTDHDPITVPVEPNPAQQLGNHACAEIQLAADAANTHPVYVSGAGVSSTKTPGLNAEDVETIKRVSNSNTFYVVAAATHTGQKLRYRTR